MNRLQKFVEQDGSGEKLGRTAYAISRDKLPPPGENLDWNAVPSFNAAEKLMRDPGLRTSSRLRSRTVSLSWRLRQRIDRTIGGPPFSSGTIA